MVTHKRSTPQPRSERAQTYNWGGMEEEDEKEENEEEEEEEEEKEKGGGIL